MNIVQPIRNREDIEKMKAVLKRKKRDLVLFIFGINCGLRISDILKLDVGDVKGRDFVEIKEKKTKKNKRFPLNPELKVVLEDFVKDRPEDEPLFITQQGNRLDRNQAYRVLNKAAKTLNLQDKIGTHSCAKPSATIIINSLIILSSYKRFSTIPTPPSTTAISE